jgi:hypothetical protein
VANEATTSIDHARAPAPEAGRAIWNARAARCNRNYDRKDD